MSDHTDDSARPAKRARLDDNSSSTLAADTSAPAPQAAAIAPIAAIDTDLEREVRAGITEYVCPDNLGFTGVLKQRYTDFLVNEIAQDGQVLHLKSTDTPQKERKTPHGKQSNGTAPKKENTSGAKVVVREENGDAPMPDVVIGDHSEQSVPVKTEETPAQEEKVAQPEGDQIAEPKQEEEKPEPEVEVGLPCSPCKALLTVCSLRKRIATHYTPYSAKIPQTRSSNSSSKYGNAISERRKTSKQSLRRP
jgi:tRNA pseudouridine13 synthase